jgi:hypothetical protein
MSFIVITMSAATARHQIVLIACAAFVANHTEQFIAGGMKSISDNLLHQKIRPPHILKSLANKQPTQKTPLPRK